MKRNKLLEWIDNSDGALDDSVARALEDVNESDPAMDVYAQRETAREQRRADAQAREHAQYLRIHEWSQHSGARIINRVYRVMALVLCLGIIFFLMSTILALPPFGEADNPVNNDVSRRYLEDGPAETGAVNMVTGMILDYRAFDTFGESTVLFTAACSVLLLLKLNDHKDGKVTTAWLEAEYDDRHHEPKNDQILQLAAKVLVPVILLFGMYVILNGHISPGGGFSGGAVMGAGLIFYLNAFGFQKTERFFTYGTFRWITFLSLMTYAGLKSYSFFTGANHIPSGISTGTLGAIFSSGFILPLNICVGLIVMCTMYTFYTLFRKGGM